MEAFFVFKINLLEMRPTISGGFLFLKQKGNLWDAAYIFQILGTTGSLIMCASSIPQIMKTCRMKCADNLSSTYLAILMMGMSLMLLYAVYVRDTVFIFGNSISLILTGILIVLRYKYNVSTRGMKY